MPSAAKSILIVDDHADTRATLAELFADEGYQVTEAANGRDALHVLVTEDMSEPTVILLDLEMPTMGGSEFLTVLRSYHRLSAIPVVVVSGHELQRRSISRSTIAGFVRKPYRFDHLLAIVQGAERSRAT